MGCNCVASTLLAYALLVVLLLFLILQFRRLQDSVERMTAAPREGDLRTGRPLHAPP